MTAATPPHEVEFCARRRDGLVPCLVGVHRPRPETTYCKTNHCLSRFDWPWEELDTWLVFLIGNVGLDDRRRWRDAQRCAGFMGRL